MGKYIIRVYSINFNKEKVSVKKFFKQFGKILKFEKKFFKNNNFECFLKIYLDLEKKKKLIEMIINNFKNLHFKFKIKDYLKYRIEDINKKVFINKLPNGIKKIEIFNSFKSYGRIDKIIMCNNNKNNINFGFIYFVKKISALNLLKDFSNHFINENYVDINIKKNNNNKRKKMSKNKIFDEKKRFLDDFYFQNTLTLYKVWDKVKRSKSLKTLTDKNQKITKFNLLNKQNNSKENTSNLKHQLLKQILNDLVK